MNSDRFFERSTYSGSLERPLSRTQRNAVLAEIEKHELSPAEFLWRWTQAYGGTVVSVLIHAATESYFTFDGEDHGHSWVNFGPGPMYETTPPKYLSECFPGLGAQLGRLTMNEWQGQLNACIDWLKLVRAENSAPDLWSGFNGGDAIDAAAERVGNEPFSSSELTKLATAISEVREYARARTSLHDEQLKSIDEKLNYLVDSAKRLGKRDWTHIARDVLTRIAISMVASATKDSVRDFYYLACEHIVSALGWVDTIQFPLIGP